MIFFQINIPTPTPFPDSTLGSPIEIPEMSLWTFADDAIQIWNKGQPLTSLLSAIILIGLVVGAGLILVSIVNQVTKK